MKVRNRPSQYVKRADLSGRIVLAKNGSASPVREPKVRDFASAKIDSRFYISFSTSDEKKEK